ncbi:MAG: sulfotransferase [Deltaproteobacteria bacterium]|nr:sulfotransferase [Deltaproteobacteria bacterium]
MATGSDERRLILILSSERSGSTLTRVVLGANSRIVSPQEMFLMRYPDYRTFREEKAVARESLVELFEILGQPKDLAAIDAACAGRDILDVYRWLFGFLKPDQFLLDKTPAYANDGETLRRSRPLQPFYLWLVRHPLGVIESHVRLKFRERHTKDLKGIGRRLQDFVVDQVVRTENGMLPVARGREVKWVLQQTIIREFLASVPDQQKIVIKFEHLVRDPEPVVGRLCDALGVAVEPAMLAACGARKVMNTSLGDPNFHTHDRIEAKTADTWRQVFQEKQLTLETRRLMDAIGVVRD